MFGQFVDNFDQLLQDARAGDTEALGRLLQGHADYLLRAAHRELPADVAPRKSPSDVVQDSYLEAHRAFPSFQGRTREEFLRWLWSILCRNVANTVREHRSCAKRSVSREVPLADAEEGSRWELLDPEPSPSEEFAKHEEAQHIRRVLAEFPPVYQEVVRLHFREGASFKAISARLGCSESGACRMLRRVMSHISEDPALVEIRRNRSA